MKSKQALVLISGPFITGAGMFMVIKSEISLEELRKKKWIKDHTGRPKRQYIVEERFYKTEKSAVRQKAKMVEKGWNEFYSANLCMN